MEFLDEVQALEKLSALLASVAEARLAVAFWGDGAVEKLGLGRRGLDLKIVCNLDSGACNPNEMRKLLAIVGEGNLLSDPRLHGKVYWTPDHAVLGSSNASANGLAVESGQLTGWAEANLLVNDPIILARLKEWFDERSAPANAYVIDNAAIELAEEVWKRRSRSAPPGIPLNRDLLAAYRAAPDHDAWNAVRLAIFTKDIDAKGRREAEREKSSGKVPDAYEPYQYWNDQIKAGEYLIEFDLSSREAEYNGIYKIPSPKIESETLCYARRVVGGIILPGFGRLTLSKLAQEQLCAAAAALLVQNSTRSDRSALVSLHDAVAHIDSSTRNPRPIGADPCAFEDELLRLSREAEKLGYKPTGFRGLVQQHGGVGAVKILLQRGKPAEGFIKLFLAGRTDLSIEHLALQEPWSTLFDEAELKQARKHLETPR